MRLLLTAIVLLIRVLANGQDKDFPNALKIGDQMPDIVFKNATGFAKKNPRLSDFKGKLVILDFWSTFCGSCLSAMPKMDTFQQKFKNQIQIILVNAYETAEDIQKQMQPMYRTPKIQNAMVRLPQSNGDLYWNEILPRRVIPHHVWIDPDGKIIAITDGYRTNEKSIEQYLTTKTVNLRFKDDIKRMRPLGLLLHSKDQTPELYSGFYPFISDPGDRYLQSDTANNKYMINYVNQHLKDLVLLFFGSRNWTRFTGMELTMHNIYQRVLLRGNVATKLIPPTGSIAYHDWLQKYGFTYEQVMPLSEKNRAAEMARADMVRYASLKYNIGITVEAAETECYIIKVLDPQLLKTKGGKRDDLMKGDSLIHFVNVPLNAFYSALTSKLEQKTVARKDIAPKPVVLEFEPFSFNIDIELKGNLNDYTVFKSQLKKYGIELTVAKKTVDYIVFTDLKEPVL